MIYKTWSQVYHFEFIIYVIDGWYSMVWTDKLFINSIDLQIYRKKVFYL